MTTPKQLMLDLAKLYIDAVIDEEVAHTFYYERKMATKKYRTLLRENYTSGLLNGLMVRAKDGKDYLIKAIDFTQLGVDTPPDPLEERIYVSDD